MPRVSGVDIPPGKRIDVALTYIYGIGPHVSIEILRELRIDAATRARDVTEEQISQLNQLIERKFVVEGQLRRQAGSGRGRTPAPGRGRGRRWRARSR
jgi:small subunit ribosomal protein S13